MGALLRKPCRLDIKANLYLKHTILRIYNEVYHLTVKDRQLWFNILNSSGGTEVSRPLEGIFSDSPDHLEQKFFKNIENRSVNLSYKLYKLKETKKNIKR